VRKKLSFELFEHVAAERPMNTFVPYSRRQPRKPVEPHTVLARLYIEPGPRHEFRIQVLQNLEAVIGVRRPVNWTRTNNFGEVVTPSTIWKAILAAVEHEYGFSLSGDRDDTARNSFADWFLREDQPNTYILSAMEFAFRIASHAAPAIASYQDEYHSRMTVEQAVADVNERFKQHDLDYFLDPESLTIRAVDSEFLHVEVVTPALTLIRQSGFQGAESEFTRALEHHRHNRQEEAIADALKAFESSMKQICDERGWAYDPHKDTAKALIGIMIHNELVPKWVVEQFSHLRMVLETGTPTARNKTAGHGAGSAPRTVPPYVAAYALHTAGANIVFLIEAHKDHPI
jgi:Domain of unknown function (DUF7014)